MSNLLIKHELQLERFAWLLPFWPARAAHRRFALQRNAWRPACGGFADRHGCMALPRGFSIHTGKDFNRRQSRTPSLQEAPPKTAVPTGVLSIPP